MGVRVGPACRLTALAGGSLLPARPVGAVARL